MSRNEGTQGPMSIDRDGRVAEELTRTLREAGWNEESESERIQTGQLRLARERVQRWQREETGT